MGTFARTHPWMSSRPVGFRRRGRNGAPLAASKRSNAVNEINLDATLGSAHSPRNPPPFSASEWCDGIGLRVLSAPVSALVDRLLALPALAEVYRDLPQDGRPFWDRALAALDVRYAVVGEPADIPVAGPLVVVANHPYGGLDGLVLGSLLCRVRPDVRLLGNSILGRIPEVRRASFLVDPFGRASSTNANAAAMKGALRWVRDGGALAVFPAGEVAHARACDGRLLDQPWSDAIARLAAIAGAAVLPVYFDGGNSRLFSAVGRLHPRLRTALLVRELLEQRHLTLTVRVGRPIPAARLKSFHTPSSITAFMRLRTEALADDRDVGSAASVRPRPEAIAPAEPSDAVRREIEALPAGSVLGKSGSLTVCIADAAAIPHALQEIGRLREMSFRAVGEGAGLARDLDDFDRRYLHLIVWNGSTGEIVGSYRVGRTDHLDPDRGAEGLYTRTLFRYDQRLLNELGPALELGRAFVRPEYQRDYSPLLLLWKGIGAYVARNPKYRRLFGTVSISADYKSISQQLLAAFLQATSFRDDLARWVEPKNPPPFLRGGRGVPRPLASVVRTVADVGALVAEIEADGKGVPVLLRQYLKLNAKLLGFNVDHAFGGVLDGLMMVDLMELPPELRARYMGRDGSDAFAAYHAGSAAPATLQNCASHT
jgi:putative hemolysin